MSNFIFDLQRFDTLTLVADEPHQRDGVTYTALNDAQLNLDDDGKVSGIASGSVIATVTGKEDSPTVTFDAADGAISFSATGNGEVLTVTTLFPIEFIGGEFTYRGNQLILAAGSAMSFVFKFADYSFANTLYVESELTYTFHKDYMTNSNGRGRTVYTWSNGVETRQIEMAGQGAVRNSFTERGFTLLKGSSEAITIGGYTVTATALEDAGVNLEFGANGLSLVPNTNDGTLNIALSRGDTEIISGELECTGGSITLGYDHAVTFEKGTSFNFTWNNYVSTITATDEATVAIALTDSGITFTPGSGDGGLNLLLRKNGKTVFAGELNITDGSITFNSDEQKFSFTEGTKIQLGIRDEEIGIEVVGGDASFKVEANADGSFTITPDNGDGKLNLTLSNDEGDSISATLEVLSGSFTLGDGGTLSLAKDTELELDFGGGYVVNLKTTDAAGGSISLSTDGITFAPNSDDGGLKLTVTRDGVTRTASLDVTGSVTYKLDGSIFLAQGTVVKNVFEDGNILTITANTDAGGSIVFNPQTGLIITPSTPDALDMVLAHDDLKIMSIYYVSGAVNYKGGVVTVIDGAEVHLDNNITGYSATIKSVGGSGSFAFGENSMRYTANENTKLLLAFSDGYDWELQNGTVTILFTDTEHFKQILTAGSIFKSGSVPKVVNPLDADLICLETAGNYTLNDINISAAKDDTEIYLPNYDTIHFASEAGVTANGCNFGGNGSITITNGGGFMSTTITKGTTLTLDGVTYTALDDTQLNLDDDGKVSGIASGSVTAKVTGKEDSPTVTFDATDGAFNFTATGNGEVISITPFPIEFISGEFTYTGGRIDITAGSDLAVSTQRGDYVLRNENHFETDSAYIFTATSLTSDAEHVISKFSLTNGSDTRELNLEQLGKVVNTFAESGFTLVKGSSEVLNMGNYKLTATATNADAGLNMELGEAGLTFVPNKNDGTLNVSLSRNGNTIFGGELECTNGSITLGYDHAVTFAKDTSFNFTTPNNTVLTVTANGEATTAIALTDNGITFTPGSGDGGLDISLSKKGSQVFEGSLNITDGTITFDTDERKFSFSDGTKIALGIGNLELGIEVVGDTTVGNGIGASFKIDADANGNLIFTPDENGGSFNISLKRDDATLLKNSVLGNSLLSAEDDDLETLFENNVTVSGPIMFNLQTGLLTLVDGTEFSLAFKNYTLTATAKGDASSTLSLTEEGISITPELGDGKLNLALGSANGSMSVDIEVLSGGFVFGFDETLKVVEGTELQLTFSDDYIVNFKATDAAGGALSIGEDGITFAPNSEDGGLELSVTRDGETRTASLDVTGSLTYKLDGSISLAEGTVVKNVFEDGNVLTITANTDAGGSIVFNPSTGLTITPSTPDAFNLVLKGHDGIGEFDLSEITGTIAYSNSVVTLSDGASFAGVCIFDYNVAPLLGFSIKSVGGDTAIDFDLTQIAITPATGASATMFNSETGNGWTMSDGTITVGYFNDELLYTLPPGSEISAAIPLLDFILETAGTYTINGMNVTTASDNVRVLLTNYDTITVDGMGYTALDDNVTLTIGDGVTTCAGGEVNLTFEDMNMFFNFDTTNGSLSYDSTNNKLSLAAGAVVYIQQDDFVVQLTAKEDISATAIHTRFDIPYFQWDGTPTFAIAAINNGTQTFGGDLTFGGGVGHKFSSSNFSLIDSNTHNIHDSYMELTLGNYKVKLATDGDTSFAELDMSTAGKILVNYYDENYNAPKLTISRGNAVIFDSSISVTGAIILDTENHTIGLSDASKVTFAFKNYTLTATAKGDAAGAISFTEEGISFTPQEGDGTLNLTLDSTDGSKSADIEILSGGFFFGLDGTLNVVKDTELQITFSDDYIVNLKATDAAGGAISLGEDGITFTPNEDDGGLELSVTKNDETRTASLDVTGSLTYKLDGSITLAEGTVVKNEFASGRTLSITANTDASGSIRFDTEDGLTITPAASDALTVTVSRDTAPNVEFTEIIGSISYSGGIVTLADGTEFNGKLVDNFPEGDPPEGAPAEAPPAPMDGDENVSIKTEGGTSTVDFTQAYAIVYAPGEGATLTLDIGPGSTPIVLTAGSISDGGSAEGVPETGLFAGTNLTGVFKPPITLFDTGSYTLNDMNLTTASDNVKVQLTESGTITVDGISYKMLDDAAQLTFDSDGKVSGLASGSVQATLAGEDDSPTITFDATDGAIDFAATDDDALAVTFSGRVFKFTEGTAAVKGDTVTTGAVKFSTSGNYSHADYEFTVEDAAEFTITTDVFSISSEKFSVSVSAGDSTLNFDVSGTAIRDFTDHTFALAGGTTVATTLGDLTITAATTDEAGGEFSFTSKGITFAPNANDGSLNVSISHAGTPIFSNGLSLSNGSIAFNPTTQEISLFAGTKISATRGEQVIMLTASEDISASYKVEDEIFYLMLDDSAKANISVVRNGQTVIDNANFEVGGVFSYRPETGTFGLTGASSSYGDGTNTFAQLTLNGQDGSRTFRAETNDVTLVFIPTYTDGKFEFNFPNENKHAMKFTISDDGQTAFSSNIAVDGTVGIDPDTQEISLAKGTVLTLTQGTNDLEITALDEAGGKLTVTDDGIRFVPNADDGKLELSFVNTGRKATLDITGAVVFGNDGKLSLEDGTEVNLAWEDGNSLKLTSSGSTGSISFVEKGLKITTDDENLNMTFSTPSMSTDISGIKGTIYYNAGDVSFDENSKITATTTLGGQPIFTTLETLDGTGHISFNTTNGVIYAADTGALRVTWSRDDLESTFTINSGYVQIGHGLFKIAEGTDLATDLKDFVPALYFTTAEAGTYTINGQEITTSAEGLALTATDNYMSFTTSDDVVTYDGMTFAGTGKVSLTADNVILGAGVEAAGFGEGNSFVLAEAGNVTADAKVFELTELDTPIKIPMEITVTGAQDGFTFSRTLTKESEAYLDDALTEEAFGSYSSAYIGKVFSEKFISAGDSSYRIRTDAIGLEDVIGISDGATVTGGASLADEPTLSYYNLVTDTEGTFTIGDKAYNVSGDSSVAITARFDVDTAPYASKFASLNGTISGDFTGGTFSINGSSTLQILGDSAIDIVANANGMEIFNVSDNATLAYCDGVSKANTDTEGTFTFGATEDNSIAITVRGDDNITFEFNEAQFITSITNLEGNISFSETGYYLSINGISGTFSGEFSSIGAYSGAFYFHDIKDGSEFVTDYADKIWLQMLGTSFALNGNSLTLLDDSDGIWIRDKEITGLDDRALLRVSEAAAYTVNSTTINANADDYIVGDGESSAYLLALNNSTVINGTEADDYLSNGGASVTINALGGDDTVANLIAENVIINGDAGNDELINTGSLVTMNGGDGDDIIFNIERVNQSTGEVVTSPESVLINGGDDNDYIIAEGSNLTINGGTGNDSIENDGSSVTINAGEGDDSISNRGDNVSIDAGNGNDTIRNSGSNVYVNSADGNNRIRNVDGQNDTLITGNGNDTIGNGSASTFIQSGGGNDSIANSAAYVTVDAGDGNDFIRSFGANSYYTAGAGNDSVLNGAANVTINAGEGDDSITNSGDNVLIEYAGGNDTISGFNATSTLSIAEAYSTAVSGDDLIVTVGESKITLLDAAGLSSPNIESNNPVVTLVETILKRTAAGYPAMAAIAFDPEGKYGDEPTNYSAKEDWTITSADDLELHAVHYTPEDANDKWVVLVHGYGNKHNAMYIYAGAYLANGYNVLMIDQRTAGESEGEWLTMGAAESQDVALWTQEIARRNSNAKITLHGVSMGSATAMLAAARSDSKNVTSLVEDCGYTSAMEVFFLLNDAYVKAPVEVIAAMDPVGKVMTGYYLHDAAPINSISAAKMPTLFITGDADSVVPVSMLSELYDASGAEVKEKFIVEGVPHALAVFNDSIGYNNAVFRFIAEANGEGWTTSSATDNISLRGTKYDDTIYNYGASVTIDVGDGNDFVSNDGPSVSISAGAGDDYIANGKESVTVDGGTGNDYIQNLLVDNVTINGGSGDDTILSNGDSNSINGDDGNDSIVSSGSKVTINGDAGADYIENAGTTVTIKAGTGNDTIVNNVDSSVTTASLGNLIEAGAGDDYLVSYHSYHPTLLGGAGKDSIVVNRGHMTFIDGGAGNDTIIGQTVDTLEVSDWAMGGHATILGGEGNDYINPFYTNDSSIDGGDGNDTIITSGVNSTVNGGAGRNLIRLTETELDDGAYIVLRGQTTVEGFKTGFGEGTDSIYITGDPGVDFKKGGLTLYDGTDSLTLGDVHDTAKVYLYYAETDWTRKEIFIAPNDWYEVTDSDLTVEDNQGAYFVGTSAYPNHGVDFSGISSALNVTMNTAYDATDNSIWVNNVHSLKGGAGNTTITGSDKSDTIIAGTGSTTINAGAGENLVNLAEAESALIHLAGNTTVEGFQTGFGDGTDTIYIDGDPAGVYFKDGILTFANSTDSLTLSDVTTTAKVNIYHERRQMLNKGVFIAAGDWYSVESGDLTVGSGEEVYFVGTAANPKAGIDFSGISSALNVTMNTAYIDSEDYVPGTSMWINGVYSLKGGAGLTTVTGSDLSDTIIAGTGSTTIDGKGGNDRISLGSAQALVKYTAGDGSDSIYGFNENSTLSIAGGSYSSVTRGNDLILTVDSDKVTLFGAADLDTLNIIGTTSDGSDTQSGGSSSSSKKRRRSYDSLIGGGSTSTTSGGSSTSTTSGGSSTSTTSSGSSTSPIYSYSRPTTSGSSSSSTTSSGSNATVAPAVDYVYTGGDQIISNYASEQKIMLGTLPTGYVFGGGNFALTSDSGTLLIQDANDKVIDLRDGANNPFAKAYAATTAGVIDGRNIAGFEVIAGSDAGADYIFAGDGGSSLWGGSGAYADTLVGGAGLDIFVGGKNAGNDIFVDAAPTDLVQLSDVTLSDVIASAEVGNAVAVAFNTGNVVMVGSTDTVSAAFALADGNAYRYNHASKAWQNA